MSIQYFKSGNADRGETVIHFALLDTNTIYPTEWFLRDGEWKEIKPIWVWGSIIRGETEFDRVAKEDIPVPFPHETLAPPGAKRFKY